MRIFIPIVWMTFSLGVNATETRKDTLLTPGVSKKDSTIVADRLSPENVVHMIPEVIVLGHNTPQKVNFGLPKTELQLIGIQSADMNFNPLNFLIWLRNLLAKKRHKETARERTARILREYDSFIPYMEEGKAKDKHPQ